MRCQASKFSFHPRGTGMFSWGRSGYWCWEVQHRTLGGPPIPGRRMMRLQWQCLVVAATALSCACSAPSQGRIDALEERLANLESAQSSSINLLPAGRGSSDLPVSTGALLVRVDSLVAHSGGTRVHLTMGNPTSATLLDLAATARWGPVGDAPTAASREITIKAHLQPAAWTPAAFDLPGVPPREIGVLRLAHAQFLRITFAP